MGLVLTVDITVGVTDVDLAKLCEEIDAGTISSPEIGSANFSVAHVAGEQATPKGLFAGDKFAAQSTVYCLGRARGNKKKIKRHDDLPSKSFVDELAVADD